MYLHARSHALRLQSNVVPPVWGDLVGGVGHFLVDPPPIRPHNPHLLTLTSPHPWSSPFLTTYPLHGSLDWP